MWTSLSCLLDNGFGASSIMSRASLFFGKAIVSRIESAPNMIWINLSKPHAMPPWGGAPNFRASSRNPNFSLCSFLPMSRTSNTFDWISCS